MEIKTTQLPAVQTYLGKIKEMPEYKQLLDQDSSDFAKLDSASVLCDTVEPGESKKLLELSRAAMSFEERMMLAHIKSLRTLAWRSALVLRRSAYKLITNKL